MARPTADFTASISGLGGAGIDASTTLMPAVSTRGDSASTAPGTCTRMPELVTPALPAWVCRLLSSLRSLAISSIDSALTRSAARRSSEARRTALPDST